jgi:hypothetical protein
VAEGKEEVTALTPHSLLLLHPETSAAMGPAPPVPKVRQIEVVARRGGVKGREVGGTEGRPVGIVPGSGGGGGGPRGAGASARGRTGWVLTGNGGGSGPHGVGAGSCDAAPWGRPMAAAAARARQASVWASVAASCSGGCPVMKIWVAARGPAALEEALAG